MEHPQLLDLIGEIYEAALNPAHWDRVLKQLCQQFDIKSAALLIHDLETDGFSIAGHHGIASIVKHTYSLGLGRLDIGWKVVTRYAEGAAFQFACHEETRREHPFFYNMVMRPMKAYYMGGLCIYNSSEWRVGLGLHRNLEQGPFEAQTLADLEKLAPHFARAMRMQREFHRLRVENFRLGNVLSRVMMGVIVVNEWREVVYRNPVADQILANNPTLKLCGKSLSAYRSDETATLNRLIDELLQAPHNISRSLGLTHPAKASPLTLTCTNIDPAETLENLVLPVKGVALYLADPNLALLIRPESLWEVYKLTPAEAKVAIMVANGMELRDIAAHNQVSVLTVRTQLRHAFDKMGVNRQQDIVKLLMGGGLNLREADAPAPTEGLVWEPEPAG